MKPCLFAACIVLVAAPSTASAQRLNVWLQLDYQHGQDSVDQLDDADGAPLNQNRVLIPRARVRLSEEWRLFELTAEADFNTVHGAQVGARALEAAIVWPPHPDAPFPNFRFETQRAPKPGEARATAPSPVSAPTPVPAADGGVDAPGAGPPAVAAAPAPTVLDRFPLELRLGGGIFRAPFGYAVYEERYTERLFASPPLLEQAYYPGDYDLGARLSARWHGLELTLAMQNGEPLAEKSFPGLDPNDGKDWFGRLTGHFEPARWLSFEAGASGTWGVGFHPGTPATKDVLVWRDLNEDGIAQLSELVAIRGSAATPSQNFERWGLGGDLRVKLHLPLGDLTLFGEVATAQNLERGIRPADPVLLGRPQRSVSAYGGFTQEILGRVLAGVRADYYSAELDQSRLEAGTLVRAQQPFTNFSFALAYCFGSSFPFGKGRLMADYTLRRDALGRDAAGRPTDLRNDLLTIRLQLEL